MDVPRETVDWLMEAEEGYVHYNAARLFSPGEARKKDLLADRFVKENLGLLKNWNAEILTRHDKSDLLLHRLALVAELGVTLSDPGLKTIVSHVLKHRDESGIPFITIQIPKVFGGEDKPELMWTMCDFPLLLYAARKMEVPESDYRDALAALEKMVEEDGCRCLSSKPKFRGPGAKTSICPYGNLLTARALGVHSQTKKSAAAGKAVEALLGHWEERKEKKYFLFGVGTDYKKLKFPFVWYNLLNVVDAVSLSPAFHADKRFREMWDLILSKSDRLMRFTPESIYRAYKDEEFSDKKKPSRMITLCVFRIARRLGELMVKTG